MAGLSYKEAMLIEIATALNMVNARNPKSDDKEEWGEDG